MKALLLAAGFGTRLRPLTNSVPKCLVPINGRPLLGIWFDLLFRAGIDGAVVNTHYLSDQVIDFVAASGWSDRIELIHEQELLGTGGTVLANAKRFGLEPFMIAHADNLTRFDVAAFVEAHHNRPSGTVMTMMTFTTDSPQSCGITETTSDGVLVAFHEKVANPPGNRANAAVYIVGSEIVDFLSGIGRPQIDLSTEVIPHFLGRIATWHNAVYHRDIGTPESLALAEAEFPQA